MLAPTLFKNFDFTTAPSFLIRRLNQISVMHFTDAVSHTVYKDITPSQLAVLNTLIYAPGVDQVTISNHLAFDAATSGSVISRLETKGWIMRKVDSFDKRRRLLWITAEGLKVVEALSGTVDKIQKNLMSPLSEEEQKTLLRLLNSMVLGNSISSRF